MSHCECFRPTRVARNTHNRSDSAVAVDGAEAGPGEVGHLLAEHWQLPVEIAEAIRFHLTPEHAIAAPEVAAVVSLAARLADMHRHGVTEATEVLDGCEAAISRLNLASDKLMKIYADFGGASR